MEEKNEIENENETEVKAQYVDPATSLWLFQIVIAAIISAVVKFFAYMGLERYFGKKKNSDQQ